MPNTSTDTASTTHDVLAVDPHALGMALTMFGHAAWTVGLWDRDLQSCLGCKSTAWETVELGVAPPGSCYLCPVHAWRLAYATLHLRLQVAAVSRWLPGVRFAGPAL